MIKRCILYIFILVLLCRGVSLAQNVDDLRKDKEQAESQLRETNRELQKNLKSASGMLNELELLNAEINDRNKLINKLTKEVSSMNRRQREMNDTIYLLQRELNAKQSSYAKAIRNMSRRRSDYDELMFIFSAESLNQSYRRMRYLKEYSAWRKRQASEIVERQAEIKQKKEELNKIIEERQAILNQRTKEANRLKSQQGDKKEFVAQLKKKEKSLRQEAKKQRSQIEALDKKIDQIIAEEARKAAERARAEAEAEAARLAAQAEGAKKDDKVVTSTQPETTPKPENKPSQSAANEKYTMTRADRELAGSFAKNKGKLPFPIKGQYRIVGHFGLQKHPEFKYLDKNNLGIDIETTPGTRARAVFNGVVAHVFSFGGATKAIMIRHGDYYTVYTGLIEVYVKAGDEVKTYQELGLIYSDPKDNSRTRMSFQIRKEMQKLNPELWLNI